jgi:hypothetical protein
MGLATKEIEEDLGRRYDVAMALLRHMEAAFHVYAVRSAKKQPEINIPRCSKEHLGYVVKELTEYTEELHRVRCGLSRLLESGSGMDD